MRANKKIDMTIDWYYANLSSLLRKYRGRYIAFTVGNVIGSYDDQASGVRGALSKGHEFGTFVCRRCIPRREEEPVVFSSLGIG